MTWNKTLKTFLAAAFGALSLWGCGGGTGTLSVGLTDAATDQYKAVYVTIAEVQVHKSGDGEDSWKTVGTPNKTYDLLQLVNGVRESLGLADLDAGHYTQMRLILSDDPDDGVNVLSHAHPFANYAVDTDDLEHELKVPSGFQTGIKIVQGFDINENETTELILDFDAGASVVIAGNSGQYLLKPTIKVLDAKDASIIDGTVTAASDDGAVEGAVVSAQIYDGSAADPKDAVVIQAATVTDADGRYALFLSPGAYNLVVYKEGFQAAATRITVAAGETATQDVSLEAASTGTVSGTTAIAGGDPEAFVTLSFRQDATIDGDAEQIELASRNVANGGTYSVPLPEGGATVVGSSFGATTQSAATTVTAGSDTILDFDL
ncbi:MAG TPA: DUF4382 domain-containing protein [bacterium]|nr:DUF4382 domain-containing protein [bacterium]